MSPREQNFGPAVVDGAPRYFSPSSLTIADTDQYGGCFRRWFYKYVLGLKEPFTAAQKRGVEVHGQIDHYLRTGEKLLGTIALAGAHFIPKPDPSLMVEFTMVETERVGEVDHIIGAPLTAAGVPVVGYGDLLIRGASHYIDAEGELRPNMPGTVEPIDWKTTSSLDNAKTGAALLETVQMPAYGEWAARIAHADHVRLSHVYFSTAAKPRAIKRTAAFPREVIARRWEQIEGVARSCVDLARETNPDAVPGNQNACGAWRGCPRADICTIKKSLTLDMLLGPTLSKELDMSLTGKLALLNPTTPAAMPAVALDLKAQIAALKAEEAAVLAQAAAAPAALPAVATPALPAGLADAVRTIESKNMGIPAMNAPTAAAWAAAKGLEIASGAGMAGTGQLGVIALLDPSQLIQLAQELGGVPAPIAPPAAVAAGLLPPDAPASNPAIAAKPIDHALGGTAVATPAAVADAPKAKRGRPRKALTEATAADPDGPTEIYVNALPALGTPYSSLHPYIDALCASLATRFECPDVRCAPKGSPLEFGAWKGVIAAVAREKPPAAGTYVVLTRTEVDQIIVDALGAFVVATGVSA